MPTAPTLAEVQTYLGTDTSWTTAQVTAALAAEASDQASRCKLPALRTVAATTTNASATVGGAFLATDAPRIVNGVSLPGSYVTGAGIPAGATIATVATDGLTATLSAAATATGSIVATVAAPWPDGLREALFRRVVHNLALRALPLGLQVSMSDSAVSTRSVGGNDAEARRLEAPYRKRVLG